MARNPARAPRPAHSPRNPRFLTSRWVSNELRIGNVVAGTVKRVGRGWEARTPRKHLVFRSALGGSDMARRRARQFVKATVDANLARRPARAAPRQRRPDSGIPSPAAIVGLGLGTSLALAALGTVTS